MKHTLYLATFILLLPTAAGAQGDFHAEWLDSTRVRVAFSISESAEAVGSNYAILAEPYLAGSTGDTLWLAPSTFRGKKNRRYAERAAFFDGTPTDGNGEYTLGQTATYDVTLTRSDYPWLWNSKVTFGFERGRQGCCREEALPAFTGGSMVYIPPLHPMLQNVEENKGTAGRLSKDNPVLRHISEYRPYTRDQAIIATEGAMFVYFPVDKATIDRSFRGNAATLDRIIDITNRVAADTASVVKIIQIVGSASFEGPRKWNETLAARRAEALEQYIRQRVQTDDSVFERNNGGEGWADLKAEVEATHFEGRDEVLRILQTESDPDRREAAIKRVAGGRAYRHIHDNLLHDQRNSGYVRIYYDYVDDKAAAAVNKANTLIREGRYADALSTLKSYKADARTFNALGIALYMTGNKALGTQYLERASQGGNTEAEANLRQLRTIEHARKLQEGK